MNNADKYLKDGVENIESLIKDFFHFVGCVEDSNRYNNIYQFFLNEAKPTLTEDEKVILRNIRKKKKYIGRFGEYDLVAYDEIEVDGTTRTYKSGAFGLEPFSHLFQFIQPRRRI